jgi:hypothetical protein
MASHNIREKTQTNPTILTQRFLFTFPLLSSEYCSAWFFRILDRRPGSCPLFPLLGRPIVSGFDLQEIVSTKEAKVKIKMEFLPLGGPNANLGRRGLSNKGSEQTVGPGMSASWKVSLNGP